MEIADNVLSALANIFQVVAVLTAATVFFTSREKTEKLSRSILSAASWAAKNGWLAWLKRASSAAYSNLEIFYGLRSVPTKMNLFGYLNRQSLTVSFRLATLYLTLGVPTAFFFISILIIVFERNKNVKYLDIELFLILIVCTGLAARFELKKSNRLKPPEQDKPKVLIFSLLFGYVFPFALLAFIVFFYNAYGDSYAGIAAIVMAIGGGMVFYSFYQALSRFCASFAFYTPLGIIIFLGLSFPVLLHIFSGYSVLTGQFDAEYPALIRVWSMIFFVFIASCFLRLEFDSFYARIFFLTMYLLMLENVFISIWLIEGANPGAYIFYKKMDNFSIFSIFMLPGIFFAMGASVVYANAICDWLSVGITRYMILVTSRARSLRAYVIFIIFDSAIAIIFFAMTLATFLTLTHMYFQMSLIPADEYLLGLRAMVFAGDKWIISDSSLRELQGQFPTYLGNLSGSFVKFFALTALLPTMFHIAMIMTFALIKSMGRFIYSPAMVLSQRWEEALADGKQAVLSLHRAIYGGFVFALLSVIFTVGYVLSVIVT